MEKPYISWSFELLWMVFTVTAPFLNLFRGTKVEKNILHEFLTREIQACVQWINMMYVKIEKNTKIFGTPCKRVELPLTFSPSSEKCALLYAVCRSSKYPPSKVNFSISNREVTRIAPALSLFPCSCLLLHSNQRY